MTLDQLLKRESPVHFWLTDSLDGGYAIRLTVGLRDFSGKTVQDAIDDYEQAAATEARRCKEF